MSSSVENFVETSTSVGIIKTEGSEIRITSSSRSSVESSLDAVIANLKSLGEFAKASSVVHRDRYPAWEVSNNSILQKIYSETYSELFGEKPAIVGIHAGLECGLVKSVKKDMDIISIGPDAFEIHTPNEHLSASSTEKLYKLLISILQKLS